MRDHIWSDGIFFHDTAQSSCPFPRMRKTAAFRDRAGFREAELICSERHFPANLFRILLPIIKSSQDFPIAGGQAGDHSPHSVHLLPQRYPRFRRLIEGRRGIGSRLDGHQAPAPQHRSPDMQRDAPMRHRLDEAHQAGWIANFPRPDCLEHDHHNLVHMVVHRLWIDAAK